jgi:hypothetical protein
MSGGSRRSLRIVGRFETAGGYRSALYRGRSRAGKRDEQICGIETQS